MEKETFLNLINESMQESARLVRSLYVISREKALAQVAMLQAAKEQYQATSK